MSNLPKAKPETKKHRKQRLELIKLMMEDGKKILRSYGIDLDNMKEAKYE